MVSKSFQLQAYLLKILVMVGSRRLAIEFIVLKLRLELLLQSIYTYSPLMESNIQTFHTKIKFKIDLLLVYHHLRSPQMSPHGNQSS